MPNYKHQKEPKGETEDRQSSKTFAYKINCIFDKANLKPLNVTTRQRIVLKFVSKLIIDFGEICPSILF